MKTTLLCWGMILLAFGALAAEPSHVPLEVFQCSAAAGTFPIEIGMPFPSGALKDAARIRLLDAGGAEVPCQVEVLSRYLDGSLRAVLLVFLSPVSKEKALSYVVEFGDGVVRKALPKSPVAAVQKDKAVNVDSGAVQFRVGTGRSLLEHVSSGGKTVLPSGLELFVQQVGQDGVLVGEQAEVTLEEAGPVRCSVLVKGRFGATPDAHGYQTRIYAYAGTGLVRVQHTVLGLDAKKPLDLAGWGLRVRAGAKKAQCGLDGSPRELDMAGGGGLFQDAVFRWTWGSLSAEELAARSVKRIPLKGDEAPGWQYRMLCSLNKGEPAPGKADGWLLAEMAGGAVGVCVRDFWQQWPKEFSATGDDVTVWLHSPRGAPFVAKAGTAKTHEVLFDFSGGGAESLRALNAVFQDWPLARLSPEWVCASGVFGPLLPRSDPFTEGYNAMADLFLEFIKQTADTIVNRACWYKYGNADFGDFHTTVSWNVPEGISREFTIEFLRGGDREWARLGARAARHYGDIDVCHAKTDESEAGRSWDAARTGPYKVRRVPAVWAGSTHGFQGSVLQATGAKRAELEAAIRVEEEDFVAAQSPRDVHQILPGPRPGLIYWCYHTGGAMPYFLLSGDRRALEVLQEQAEWVFQVKTRDVKDNVLRAVPTFQLTLLLDAHEATGEAKYLRAAGSVVGALGFNSGGYGKHAEGGIIPASRQAVALYRFTQLNVPPADTGVNSEEVKRRFAEATAASMVSKQQAAGCTPGYISAWAIAWDTGFWSEETRTTFEDKVLRIISFDRKEAPPPVVRYKIPFLKWAWSSSRKAGEFFTYDPKEMAKTYIFNRFLYHFTCDYAEFGVLYTMPGYPHFLPFWKKYHEQYLKPRMNADGVLELHFQPATQGAK